MSANLTLLLADLRCFRRPLLRKRAPSIPSTGSEVIVSVIMTVLIFLAVIFFAVEVSPPRECAGHPDRRLHIARADLVDSSVSRHAGDVLVGRQAVLCRAKSAQGRNGSLRHWQAMDVEDAVSGRQPRNQRSARAGGPTSEADDGVEDVIHSFSIPAFRVRHDVVPGHYDSLWFTAD